MIFFPDSNPLFNMVPEGSMASASDAGHETIESKPVEIGNDLEGIFSPRFKSAAAMAGWDEEALLIASLVVDDTPEREFRRKKRTVLQCKSPSTDPRRKRRTSPNLVSIPVAILDLDEEETTVKADPPKQDPETAVPEPKKSDTLVEQNAGASISRSALPCMDKLREELSCAICLEICFEPSTTPCGHSFCKKCLRSAADKCGRRCPKCRQLISNGRSCTVNTVLWNTIQLLFPQEIEARKESKGCSSQEKVQIPEKAFYSSLQTQETDRSSRHGNAARRRGAITTIRDEDGEELDSQTMRRAAYSNADSSSSVQPRQHSRSIQPVRMTMTRDASSNADSRVQLRPHRRSVQPSVRMTTTRDADRRSSRGTPDQDQDAALALRLQREEFMEAFRDNTTQVQTRSSHSLSLARANLRAMASRAAINGRHL